MDTTKPQMSGRERILAALNHQPVDRLPFTPAVDSYLMMGLPPELTGDPNLDYMHPKRQLATMKNLGFDLLVRGVLVNEDFSRYATMVQSLGAFAPPVEVKIKYLSDTEMAEIITTPVGTLTGLWKLTDKHGRVPHFTKYVVNNYEELKIFAYAVEHIDMSPLKPRFELYNRFDALLGDEGLPAVSFMNTPLMHLIQFLMGLENTYILLHEHPKEMEFILERLHVSHRRHVELIAQSPAKVVIQYEGTSSTLLSPAYYRKYCLPVQNDYARILTSAGKIHLIHMCGKLQAFINDFKGAEFSGITDIAPHPTGDLPLYEAAERLQEKVLIGGIDATTFASNDLAFVEKEVTQLIQKVKPYRGILLGSGDVVPKDTRVENIRLMNKLVNELGHYD